MAEVVTGKSVSGDGLEQVAFAADPAEAGMIQGLLEGAEIPSLLRPTGVDGRSINQGLLAPGPQRVFVNAGQADAARRLLTDTLVEEEQDAAPEIANARHLDEAAGRRTPRHYGVIGAYARSILFALVAFGVVFGVFLLLRAI